MTGADRGMLRRVRTQVALFLDTIAQVLGPPTDGVVAMVTLCASTVQAGAIPDEDLAGALHVALLPHRHAVAGSPADKRRFVETLVDVAVAPLETQLRLDTSSVRSFCADPANQESLIKWASKLLRATEAAASSASK